MDNTLDFKKRKFVTGNVWHCLISTWQFPLIYKVIKFLQYYHMLYINSIIFIDFVGNQVKLQSDAIRGYCTFETSLVS